MSASASKSKAKASTSSASAPSSYSRASAALRLHDALLGWAMEASSREKLEFLVKFLALMSLEDLESSKNLTMTYIARRVEDKRNHELNRNDRLVSFNSSSPTPKVNNDENRNNGNKASGSAAGALGTSLRSLRQRYFTTVGGMTPFRAKRVVVDLDGSDVVVISDEDEESSYALFEKTLGRMMDKPVDGPTSMTFSYSPATGLPGVNAGRSRVTTGEALSSAKPAPPKASGSGMGGGGDAIDSATKAGGSETNKDDKKSLDDEKMQDRVNVFSQFYEKQMSPEEIEMLKEVITEIEAETGGDEDSEESESENESMNSTRAVLYGELHNDLYKGSLRHHHQVEREEISSEEGTEGEGISDDDEVKSEPEPQKQEESDEEFDLSDISSEEEDFTETDKPESEIQEIKKTDKLEQGLSDISSEEEDFTETDQPGPGRPGSEIQGIKKTDELEPGLSDISLEENFGTTGEIESQVNVDSGEQGMSEKTDIAGKKLLGQMVHFDEETISPIKLELTELKKAVENLQNEMKDRTTQAKIYLEQLKELRLSWSKVEDNFKSVYQDFMLDKTETA